MYGIVVKIVVTVAKKLAIWKNIQIQIGSNKNAQTQWMFPKIVVPPNHLF